MRKVALSAIFVLGTLGGLGAAHAADPVGEWLVKDGVATIKIADCSGHLWGIIASEKTPGNLDTKNPDKAKRSRPTLGMPILLDMTPDSDDKGKWAGHIYNAKNGKTYEASIQPVSSTQLKVEGCVLGFLCGGETWTRVVETTPPAQAQTEMPASGGKMSHEKSHTTASSATSKGSKTVGQKGGIAPATPDAQPVSDICMLPDVTGASH